MKFWVSIILISLFLFISVPANNFEFISDESDPKDIKQVESIENTATYWSRAGLDSFSVRDMALHATDPLIIYAAITEDSALAKSTDGGINWEFLENAPTNIFHIATTAANSSHVWAIKGCCMANLSTDNGLIWSYEKYIPNAVRDIVVCPEHNDWILVATASAYDLDFGIYRTDDLYFWDLVLGGYRYLALEVDPMDPYTVYGGTQWYGYVTRSDDFGENWYQISPDGTWAGEVRDIEVDLEGNVYAATDNGLWKWNRFEWTKLTDLPHDDLSSVYFADADTGYAVGTYGTILKSIDGGNNWSIQLSKTTNTLYSVEFSSTLQGLTVGSSGKMLYVKNGDDVWSSNSRTGASLKSISFGDNLNCWAVGDSGRVLHSTDGGTDKWYEQSTGLAVDINLKSVCFINGNTGWIAGDMGLVLKTSTGGYPWEPQFTGIIEDFNSIFFINENIGWVAGDNGTILKTTNGGTNWDLISSGVTNSITALFFIDENVGWVVGTNGTILKTINGGTLWLEQDSNTHEQLNSVYFVNANTGWAVGMNGVIIKTINGGSTWERQSHDHTHNITDIALDLVTSPATIYVGTWGNGISYSANGGEYFSDYSTGLATRSIYELRIIEDEFPEVCAATYDGVWKRPAKRPPPQIEVSHKSAVFDDVEPNLVYTEDFTIYNNGTVGAQALDWTITDQTDFIIDDGTRETSIGYESAKQFLWMNRFSPPNEYFPLTLNEVHVLYRGNNLDMYDLIDIYIYEDTDGDGDPGTNAVFRVSHKNDYVWFPDGSKFTDYFIDPITFEDPCDILVAVVNRTANPEESYYPAALDESSDAGRSWVGTYTGGLPGDPPVIPATGYWGTTADIGHPGNWMIRCFAECNWLSADPSEGLTVNATNDVIEIIVNTNGLSNTDYRADLIINSNSYYNRKLKIPVTLDPGTYINNEITHLIPEKYNLDQNYPNPFNPSTIIQFSLPRLSKVEIEVYNILGQTVSNLVNEEKPAGQYRITWDGRDNSGNSVSSGIYFYKIKTDDFSSSKKMILLK